MARGHRRKRHPETKKHSVLVHGVKMADFPTGKIYEQNPGLRSRLRIVRYTCRASIRRSRKKVIGRGQPPHQGRPCARQRAQRDRAIRSNMHDHPLLQLPAVRAHRALLSTHDPLRPLRCGRARAPQLPRKDDRNAPRCANCGGRHEAGDQSCPRVPGRKSPEWHTHARPDRASMRPVLPPRLLPSTTPPPAPRRRAPPRSVR